MLSARACLPRALPLSGVAALFFLGLLLCCAKPLRALAAEQTVTAHESPGPAAGGLVATVVGRVFRIESPQGPSYYLTNLMGVEYRLVPASALSEELRAVLEAAWSSRAPLSLTGSLEREADGGFRLRTDAPLSHAPGPADYAAREEQLAKQRAEWREKRQASEPTDTAKDPATAFPLPAPPPPPPLPPVQQQGQAAPGGAPAVQGAPLVPGAPPLLQ